MSDSKHAPTVHDGPPKGVDHADHHDAHGHDDHGGIGKYIAVFLALCVLTGASFFTYSPAWPFRDTPQVGWLFMMAVSCTKAMLVILFFMHVKYEANWKYVLTIPPAIMAIFLMVALIPDVGLRRSRFSEERMKHQPGIEKSGAHATERLQGDGH